MEQVWTILICCRYCLEIIKTDRPVKVFLSCKIMICHNFSVLLSVMFMLCPPRFFWSFCPLSAVVYVVNSLCTCRKNIVFVEYSSQVHLHIQYSQKLNSNLSNTTPKLKEVGWRQKMSLKITLYTSAWWLTSQYQIIYFNFITIYIRSWAWLKHFCGCSCAL